jgi:enamine deaminase RidA (YjgF/YER057c/UK114 family)
MSSTDADRRPTTLQPAGWPRPAGYAYGMAATGRIVCVSGMIGWDAQQRLAGPDLVSQTRQALANIVAVLAEAGAAPTDVVRLTWYIVDRREYLASQAPLGAAYREIMGRHYPAMAVVEVSGLLEPGARVEIEATAVITAASG